MKASIFLSTATVLALSLSETTAFVSPASFKPALHVRTRSGTPNPTPVAHPHTTSLAQIHMKSKYAASTTIAGNLWPTIKRFKITAALGKEIVRNVMEITHWQDIALLSLLAFGSFPLAKFSFRKKASEDKKGLGGIYQLKRFGVSALVSQIGTLALSVYAVDVISVVLTTLGFRFPVKFGISAAYAKLAYTGWALQRFLLYKRLALCRFYKVDEEDMGKVEIFDRLLNGLSIGLVSLLLFDWLSVKMGIAMKGVFAFGSVGTLALTLGSQKLVAQLLSGVMLTASNKMYVGDSVSFGDGTSGKVIKQGWMETVLRQSDNIMTSVPNSILSGQKISNLSRQKQSQVKQTLRFNYDDAEQIPLLLDSIRSEIKKACPRLITDGTRPFRVFWTGYKEDYLEVMVDTHHNIAPIGDAYWQNRQNILLAISRAVKKHDIDFVQLYTLAPAQAGASVERRVFPKAAIASTMAKQEEASTQVDGTASGVANGEVDALKSKAKE